MGKQTKDRLDSMRLSSLQPGDWASCPIAGRGAGTLEARALAGGAVVYYARFTTKGKRQQRIKLGSMGLKEAKRQATALSLRYQSGERYLPAVLKRERAEQEQAEAAAEANTLGALLEAYAEQLERAGKRSAGDVRNKLRLHVAEAWPKLWAAPAANITADDVLDVVAAILDAGHRTTAAHVRAYLKAAYTAAIRARHDADALPTLRRLRITANPAADVAPVKDASKARERYLSVAELRAYWKRIETLPGIGGALLRFHLLTGCQRIAQLARATLDDYDSDVQALRLYDGKGKRAEPRVHLVPLLSEALDAMRTMQGNPYVFTATAGKSGATYRVLNKRLQAVVQSMEQAGELEHGPFTPGDLRRTVETRLAAAKVSKETRAQLQSHGITGVQAKHYDKYDYLPEKRQALETLLRIATGASARVAPMQRKA